MKSWEKMVTGVADLTCISLTCHDGAYCFSHTVLQQSLMYCVDWVKPSVSRRAVTLCDSSDNDIRKPSGHPHRIIPTQAYNNCQALPTRSYNPSPIYPVWPRARHCIASFQARSYHAKTYACVTARARAWCQPARKHQGPLGQNQTAVHMCAVSVFFCRTKDVIALCYTLRPVS